MEPKRGLNMMNLVNLNPTKILTVLSECVARQNGVKIEVVVKKRNQPLSAKKAIG